MYQRSGGSRQDLTIELAAEFLHLHRVRRCRFEPIAVAHGWSPLSYARSATQLQNIGYGRIALGGMVPLKTPDILDALKEVSVALDRATQLHLLGVTRTAYVHDFAGFGVTSFDSTSPFRQAFKDEKDNYYTLDGSFRCPSRPPSRRQHQAAEGRCQRVKSTRDRLGDLNGNVSAGCEATTEGARAWRVSSMRSASTRNYSGRRRIEASSINERSRRSRGSNATAQSARRSGSR